MANRRGGGPRVRNQQRNANFKRKNRNGPKSKPRVSDARQKIVSKNFKPVRDARDILAKKAKIQDARNKILSIRESKTGDKLVNGRVRAIGYNILQKTDRNGKISLVTSKNKLNTSNINLAVQQQLGLITPVRKKPIVRKEPLVSPPITHKTLVADYAPPSLPMILEAYNDYLSPGRYRLDRRPPREEWPSYVPQPHRGYIDLDAPEDEEMPLVTLPIKKQTIMMQGTTRSSNVHSRLDTSPINAHSHGIFSTPTKTKVVVPVGYRIVVSNLQEGVTQDDIRELFEDIGKLLVARLVRPGTAEVIYENLKDAQRAVDTYHNRQLDGQPMKCLLVNKRSSFNAMEASLTNSNTIRASSKKLSPSKGASDKLVPHLETIHKVLFQRN